MKKGYWIILLFAAWCVACALWYMFSLKKLPNGPEIATVSGFTIQSIVEILLMLTAAFFMGFGLAWLMRSGNLEQISQQFRSAKFDVAELEATVAMQKEALLTAEQRAIAAEEELRNSADLHQKIADLTYAEESLRKKSLELETKLQHLEGEHNSAKFRIRLLENEIDEKAKTVGKLTEELQVVDTKPQAVEHRDWSDHPFVRPMPLENETADDLTEIKGIGPAFQKKLNSLDIYSFRQISELDGEGVERLAEVIEVFPERIHRDNWIGQATRLYLKKIGRES